MVNGEPTLVARAGDDTLAVMSAGIRHGKIHELWIVGNPEKLKHVQTAYQNRQKSASFPPQCITAGKNRK